MIRSKLIVVVCLMIIAVSCRQEVRSINQPTRPVDEMKNDVFIKGDSTAYSELFISYLSEPPEDFLFWALLMANKYDYGPAHLDVFFSLKNAFNKESGNYSLKDMDTTTIRIALTYLKIAAHKGVPDALRILKEVEKVNPQIKF